MIMTNTQYKGLVFEDNFTTASLYTLYVMVIG